MPDDRKTEKPTPRRLRKARRDGDHPVSRALVGFGAQSLLFVLSPLALEALYQSSQQALIDAISGLSFGASGLALRVGLLAGPLLAAAALGAGVVGVWQTGGVLSLAPLRWDPFQRGRRGFGQQALSLWLALAAGLATACAGWFVARDLGGALAHTVGDARAALHLALESCRRLVWWALGVLLVFASADGALRFAQWLARHRMTPDEVRQEQRENQGAPELRQARQAVHRELANSGAASELARATLLVLGTPSLAVALRYDPHRDLAPRVLLRASGAAAALLEASAASLNVPVEHDTALAQALMAIPIDHEVPKARYADIARALQRAGMFRPVG